MSVVRVVCCTGCFYSAKLCAVLVVSVVRDLCGLWPMSIELFVCCVCWAVCALCALCLIAGLCVCACYVGCVNYGY